MFSEAEDFYCGVSAQLRVLDLFSLELSAAWVWTSCVNVETHPAILAKTNQKVRNPLCCSGIRSETSAFRQALPQISLGGEQLATSCRTDSERQGGLKERRKTRLRGNGGNGA